MMLSNFEKINEQKIRVNLSTIILDGKWLTAKLVL